MSDPIAVFSTDVLIIGAGPAGLAAALAATTQAGVMVTIIDENPAPGGQIWRGGAGHWRDSRAQALWNTLSQRTNLRIMYGARIVARVARFSEQEFLLETADGAQTIRWGKCILCTGARELLLPFPGWTLPGVTGAGGLQALIKGGMPVRGKRVVIAGSGPLLLAVADTARRAGARVVAIAEHRSNAELIRFFLALLHQHRGKFLQAIKLFWHLKQIAYRHDARVIKATGEQKLNSVSLQHGSKILDIPCDFLACGFGLLPNPELGSLLACEVQDGSIQVDAHQACSQPAIWAAGEACGIGGVDKALAEGRIAGLAATGQAISTDALAVRAQARAFAHLLNSSFATDAEWRHLCQPDTLVCRCEDVSSRQLAEHGDWRSAKLMTRAGMGACQGRICGAACQFLFGWQAPGMRLPVFPAKVATLAALGVIGAGEETH